MKIPDALTIEESVTLMMGITLGQHTRTVYEELAEIYDDASLSVHEYTTQKQSAVDISELEHLEHIAEIAKHRVEQSHVIRNYLTELCALAKNPDIVCPLEIATDEPGNIKFTKDSVIDIAYKVFRITIPSQPLPPQSKRAYKSTLLDVLDHAVKDLWRDGSPEHLPKNDFIEAWVKEQYPGIGFSDLFFKTLPTIIRPDRNRTPKEKKQLNIK